MQYCKDERKVIIPIITLSLMILIPLKDFMRFLFLSIIIDVLWVCLILFGILSLFLPVITYIMLKLQLRIFKEKKKKLYESIRGMYEILQIFKEKTLRFLAFLIIVISAMIFYYMKKWFFAFGYLAYGLCIIAFGMGVSLTSAHNLFSRKIIVEEFEPPTYSSILDYAFTDFFENWLEPKLWISFDEFLSELSEKLRGSKNAKKFLEKYLLLEYLRTIGIIEEEKDVDRELIEAIEKFAEKRKSKGNP